ncbi:MAG: CocE/NonD family hydrolase [Acidobacteriaceae bacterium]
MSLNKFRTLFLVAVSAVPVTAVGYAQTIPFRRSAASNRAELDRAMPKFAVQVGASYREDDRIVFLDHVFRLQFVEGQYQKALDSITIMRQLIREQPIIPERAAWVDVPYEIYAHAKMRQMSQGVSFEEAYRHAFRDRFARLDDWTAAEVIRTLSSIHSEDTEQALHDDLAAQAKVDTFGQRDALNLVSDYLVDKAYHETSSLIPPLIAEDDVRRYISEPKRLVKISADVGVCTYSLRPRHTGRLPTLLNFTIYAGSDEENEAEIRLSAAKGYVGIIGFPRGKVCSPGQPTAYVHDAEDVTGLINWIAKQPWSDGRVGMYGGSYEGFTQWAAAKRMPKALKTIIPAATVGPGIDVPMEGNVFWNFIYPWPFFTLDKKTDDDAVYNDASRWAKLNRDWYVSGRAYQDLDKIDGTPNPTFDEWIAHPSYDRYWQNMIPYRQEFAKVTIPVLLTAGYFYGGPGAATYYFEQLEKYAPNAEHYLLIGPYHHIGAQYGTISSQGSLRPTLAGLKLDPVAEIDMLDLRYQWFDYIFKGASRPALLADKVNYELIGTNTWRHVPSLEGMNNAPLRFYLSSKQSSLSNLKQNGTTAEGKAGIIYQLSSRPEPGHSVTLTVDLSDRSDVDRQPIGGGIIDDAVDLHNAVAFVSNPMSESKDVSGLLSGRVDFIVNKKDFDFEIDLYELNAQGQYIQLTQYWTRASYMQDRTRRHLLTPGRAEQFSFRTMHLAGRRLQAGSRLVAVINVIKESGREINYGTGKPVSTETIHDANAPLQIRWLGSSYLDVPIYTRK